MKEWSARTVMIVNKQLFLATLLFLCCGLTQTTLAKDSSSVVSSLYSVEDIVVQRPVFGNYVASNKCSVFNQEVFDNIIITLKKDHLPIRTVVGNNINEQKKKISVNLVPEIVTIKPRDSLCLSWVSFTLQSRNTIQIPPAEYKRDITLNYWDAGLLVSTSMHSHKRGIKEAIDKLSGLLKRQYSADQPPVLN